MFWREKGFLTVLGQCFAPQIIRALDPLSFADPESRIDEDSDLKH